MFIFQTQISGSRGEIVIPSLGIQVARLVVPISLLRRREVASPELGRFDLHAAVSYFSKTLWDDPDYRKVVKFYIGKRPYEVFLFPKSVVVWETGNLRVEGVEPDWDEPQQAT